MRLNLIGDPVNDADSLPLKNGKKEIRFHIARWNLFSGI